MSERESTGLCSYQLLLALALQEIFVKIANLIGNRNDMISATDFQHYETNCLKKYFGKTTDTERLIDEFLNSDKSFLLLCGFSWIHDKERGSRNIDLIAVRSETSGEVSLAALQTLTGEYLDDMKCPKCVCPLISEIFQIAEDEWKPVSVLRNPFCMGRISIIGIRMRQYWEI